MGLGNWKKRDSAGSGHRVRTRVLPASALPLQLSAPGFPSQAEFRAQVTRRTTDGAGGRQSSAKPRASV